VLQMEKQIQIMSALVEGNSTRATARMVGVGHKQYSAFCFAWEINTDS